MRFAISDARKPGLALLFLKKEMKNLVRDIFRVADPTS